MKIPREVLLGSAIFLLFLFLFYVHFYPLELLDNKIYDLFFHLRGPKKPPQEIVIAAIDETSLERLGRWPWSRKVLAKLIDKLSEAGAAVIALDIILSEAEKNDPLLAESINRAGNVLLPVVFFFDKETKALDPLQSSSILVLNPERFRNYPPISARGVLSPQFILAREASGLGHINMFPDPDGTIRWEALLMEYQGYLFPSLALKATALYLGIPKEKFLVDATRGIYLGKRFIPTDPWGRILIPYYGGTSTFKTLSIVDILEDRVKKEELEEKIVLVGAIAVGIYDLRVTPFSSAMPGVEKHANVIAGLLESKVLLPLPRHLTLLTLAFLLGLGALLYHRIRALYALAILLLLVSGVFLVAFYLFIKGYWFSVIYLSGGILTQFLTTVSLKYAYTELEARRIRKIFSSYVTERVVNELIKNPSMAKLGGERREVTVLFTDIRGFTSLSERLPPERVVEILNEYFKEMVEVIFKWEGTLDKFIGDAIMVFWGAPLPQEDHAKRAVACAVDMILRLRRLNEKWEKEEKPPLRIGVGINSGEVLVGNIGAEGKKMDYTVIGDHVNLASRLEGLNKEYNSEIIISEYTLGKIKEDPEFISSLPAEIRELGEVKVKGKERPVKIYQILVKDG